MRVHSCIILILRRNSVREGIERMKIRIVSYTARGRDTAERIASICESEGHVVTRYALQKFCRDGDTPLLVSASEWAEAGFSDADALIFCCASGIAVRSIAPWVKDKTSDPAVLVIDEHADFVIPLLSGHIGGANELAVMLSGKLGAKAVLTTATDVNGMFAVDVFAEHNRLNITDIKLCKAVSSALLSGEPVGFASELPVEGELPAGLTEGEAQIGVYVGTSHNDVYPITLHLIPRRYAAGMGCRRGKSADDLDAFFTRQLSLRGISDEELLCIASVDLKRDEEGLKTLCQRHRLPFMTYSAEDLNKAEGDFSDSGFVRDRIGVDCVCERAAVLAADGKLVMKKTAENGMTFALAKMEEAIHFV